MESTTTILVIGPDPATAQTLAAVLRREGHAVTLIPDGAGDDGRMAAVQAGRAGADLVLMSLPPGTAEAVARVSALRQAGVPRIIALTAQGSVQLAVDVMRAGALDLLLLPVAPDRLRQAVAAALAQSGEAGQEPARPGPPAPSTEADGYFGFIGAAPAMRAVYRLIESAAPSKATVFITGESGTGKEVCAEAIHRRSPRARGPFIAINCAAIPKDLMESEIFGHVKGAFTGAAADRAGAALQADGGTLFLDEICEMDLALQAKLLRFLQTGMVKKVGSERAVDVDVRIVCATNRDPFAEVQAGRFREDLFYRLQVISIELPPLRERGPDVLRIADAFLARYAREEGKSFTGFSAAARDILMTYGWPGNVRQLLNVVRNVVVLNDGAEIQPFMLPPPLNRPTLIVPPMLTDPRWAAMAGPLPFPIAGTAAAPAPVTPPPPPPPPPPPALSREEAERRIRPLWQVQEEAIDDAIRLCAGNITRAAALLEINPCTIYRRRQKKQAPTPNPMDTAP
ncbi:MAG: hypothetical protein RLY86_1390 [Pseudomonadota bacterium]|jgi:two-component system repressor protein LuxO